MADLFITAEGLGELKDGSNNAFRAGPGTTRVFLSQVVFNSQSKNSGMSRKWLQLRMLVSP